MARLAAILVSLLGIGLPTLASAKYLPPPIYDLLGASDLIVVGSISRVEPRTFHLEVEEVLVGATDSDTREIERFRDWACSQRWQPYSVGQRVVAFLERREGRYRLRSAGAEGEFPITGDEVFVHGYAVAGPPGEMANHMFRRLPLGDLRSAILDLPSCESALARVPAPERRAARAEWRDHRLCLQQK